jgi:aminopeptidase N
MTEQLSALAILIRSGKGDEAVAAFYDQWKADKLVIDKWFAIQASALPPELALDKVKALSEHPDFDWKNPNRYRSLIGAFATNHAAFHGADGEGYKFVTDWLIKLDAVNPQTTARLCGVFETWKRYDDARQSLIKAQLQRIADKPDLSKDTSEIVGKILSA